MKFMHIRIMVDGKPATKGGGTICYALMDEHVVFSVAVCSVKDNFCRKIGRQVSEGRFNVGQIETIPYNKEKDGKLRGHLYHHILDGGSDEL